MSWSADVRAAADQMRELVDSAATQLAELTHRDGRFSTALADQHQAAIYQLAFLAAPGQAEAQVELDPLEIELDRTMSSYAESAARSTSPVSRARKAARAA